MWDGINEFGPAIRGVDVRASGGRPATVLRAPDSRVLQLWGGGTDEGPAGPNTVGSATAC